MSRPVSGAGAAARLVLLLAALHLGGCTSAKYTFDGYSADQVWTAMVAVARNPVYDDWKVAANDVWIDEAESRIEVYRHLRRVLYTPNAPPQHGQQTWRLEIRLIDADPPRATITSRDFALPTNAQAETKRYLQDVFQILHGLPQEAAQLEADQHLLDALGADDTPQDTWEEIPPAGPDVEFHGPG